MRTGLLGTPALAARSRDSTEAGISRFAEEPNALLETAPSLAAAAAEQLEAEADAQWAMEIKADDGHGVPDSKDQEMAPEPAVAVAVIAAHRPQRAGKQAKPAPAVQQPRRKQHAKQAKQAAVPRSQQRRTVEKRVTRRVWEGGKVKVLLVPGRCPGCRRPPLAQVGCRRTGAIWRQKLARTALLLYNCPPRSARAVLSVA